MPKRVQGKNLSKEIYQKIYSMKYASIIKYGATYLTERADSTVLTLANLYIMSVPILTAKSLVILLILLYSLTINIFIFLVMLFILILNVAGFYILNKNLLKKSAEMQRIIPKERKDIYQIANQVDFIKQNEDNTNLNDILEKHLEIIEQENKRVNVYARGMSEVIDFFKHVRPKHYFDRGILYVSAGEYKIKQHFLQFRFSCRIFYLPSQIL